jgi:hypothetical protein
VNPTLVLSWEQHHVQHQADRASLDPVTYRPRTAYVLDESDQPPLLWCHRRQRYVNPKQAS